MKTLLLLLLVLFCGCSIKESTITATVVYFHVDDLRRSKSYVVLSTGDTLTCLDKHHKYIIGNEYQFVYVKGFKKILKDGTNPIRK